AFTHCPNKLCILLKFAVEGSMNSTSTHFVPPRRVGIYEPLHQFGMWGETFKNNIGNGEDMNTPSHIIIPNNQKLDDNNLSEDTSQGTGGTPHMFDQEASTSRHPDKIQRRLAQNREAARKSRLRKKAYVQQLETSRLKLIHLEQELDRARQQGFYVGNGIDTNSLSFSEPMNRGIATFEMEYGHWIQEQNKQICKLRTVLQGQVSDVELRLLVENGMKHYFDLFRMKSAAAKADVFFVMSGMWRTSAERFFLWIGGFRPSDLLKVLLPHFDVMTDQQILDVCNLRQSCQQAEDALSQGMEKLQHTLADCVAGGRLGEGSYIPQVNSAMERLEALVSFVNQVARILTVRREREIEEGIGKRLSRKLDRQWKKSIVVRPPPSLKKLQEEEAAEEAAEAAKSA
ncbi:unnamed protein product, partial [Brassica oleracea var. botrytis]